MGSGFALQGKATLCQVTLVDLPYEKNPFVLPLSWLLRVALVRRAQRRGLTRSVATAIQAEQDNGGPREARKPNPALKKTLQPRTNERWVHPCCRVLRW